ncbi:MAG: response regulator [Bradymonadaceae bacterium]|nr:response regulator [Lujinxingiaceae bacterium]
MKSVHKPEKDSTHADVFTGYGKIDRWLRHMRWESTPLGAPEQWSDALKQAVMLCLRSETPTVVFWGTEQRCFFNDALHLALDEALGLDELGQPSSAPCATLWRALAPLAEQAAARGAVQWGQDIAIAPRPQTANAPTRFTAMAWPIIAASQTQGTICALKFQSLSVRPGRRANFHTTLSHEIRTPLTALLSAVEALADKAPDSLRDDIRVLEDGGRQLIKILDAVLTLTSLDAHAVTPRAQSIDVVAEVREALSGLRRLAERKGLALEFDCDRATIEANLDPGYLCSILNNLVGNAIKYTAHGKVRIEIDNGADDVEIHVSDTGRGIDALFLPRIFEEFSREHESLNSSDPGAGLGLAITSRLLESCGGTISVSSEKNRGSTFSVCLPCNAKAALAGEALPNARTRRRALVTEHRISMPTLADNTFSIMLVEDDEIIRELVASQLEKHYVIEAFANAEDALERAREHTFDLIFMDISLPGMSGVDAVQVLRSLPQYSERPIVAMTGYGMPDDIARFRAAGFSNHVEKPFTPRDLLRLIEALPKS